VNALAIHICADVASAGPDRQWPYSIAAPDTVRRIARICEHAGIVEQHTLASEQATTAAVRAALLHATERLASGGVLVVTFSGHTKRGDGPIGTARWCLFDDGLELSEIARHLALLPETSRIVLICDTCYAAAIAQVLVGAQQVLVVASCSDEQTMIQRRVSEFVVRLEDFICATRGHGSVDDLRARLEHDTPDCERPAVWTNTASWWSARPLEIDVPDHADVHDHAQDPRHGL
jgi:hypothetical protein